MAMSAVLLPPGRTAREALKALEAEWRAQPVPGSDFADLEAALVRRGLELRRQSLKNHS
jgi:hypothetical protein